MRWTLLGETRLPNSSMQLTSNSAIASRKALAFSLLSPVERVRPEGPHADLASRGCSPLSLGR